MEKKEYDSFIACCRIKKFSWDEQGIPLNYTLESKPRRQEYKGILLESGAFYASTVGQIRSTGKLISGRIKTIEIGQAGLIDIDEPKDWKQAENYLDDISISNDFYVEFYDTVDNMLSSFIQQKGIPQTARSYLFQRSFQLRNSYNTLRKKGHSLDECNSFLFQNLFPTVDKTNEVGTTRKDDYRCEPWYKVLSLLENRILVYVYNNRQLRYLLPVVNSMNRPVVLVCEPNVDEEVEVGDNVVAVDLCFWDEYKVYNDNALEAHCPELFRYYNTFQLLLEALKPEGVVVLEGCHHQEQVLGDVAKKNGIPSIAMQQGWPSVMHSMFRNMPIPIT